jgi:hypothetical protein
MINNCLGEYNSDDVECNKCKVIVSCKRKQNAIIKKVTNWQYNRYRVALEKKFLLEEETQELYRKKCKLQRDVLVVSQKIGKNNKLIFDLNNDVRRHLRRDVIKREVDIGLEIDKDEKT